MTLNFTLMGDVIPGGIFSERAEELLQVVLPAGAGERLAAEVVLANLECPGSGRGGPIPKSGGDPSRIEREQPLAAVTVIRPVLRRSQALGRASQQAEAVKKFGLKDFSWRTPFKVVRRLITGRNLH